MKFKLAAFADEADSGLDKQILAMKEHDIPYLEIRAVDGENIADISKNKAYEIRKKLDDAGIAVWSIGSPYGKIGITDDFLPHLEQFKRGIETADILGAKHIRIFSFYVPNGGADHYADEVMQRLEKFSIAAKESGVILCHENEKGIYGDIAVRCKEIHTNFPEIKAVFDPANFVQCGQETKAAWEILNPYVFYMHIKDAMPDGFVVPAGEGVGNIRYLLEQYKGEVLTVEPHLSVFEGFDKLERDTGEIAEKFRYPSAKEAFDAAVNALKELIR